MQYLRAEGYDTDKSTILLHPHFYKKLVDENDHKLTPIGIYESYCGRVYYKSLGDVSPARTSDVWIWESNDPQPLYIYSGEVYKKLDKAKNIGDNE